MAHNARAIMAGGERDAIPAQDIADAVFAATVPSEKPCRLPFQQGGRDIPRSGSSSGTVDRSIDHEGIDEAGLALRRLILLRE